MSIDTILTIILSIVTIAGTGLSYYLYIKTKILEAANNVINIAEDTDRIEAEKMEIAVQELMKILPPGAKIFFTEANVRQLIQHAFDGIELFARKQINKNK